MHPARLTAALGQGAYYVSKIQGIKGFLTKFQGTRHFGLALASWKFYI